jgi:hypothetical protein
MRAYLIAILGLAVFAAVVVAFQLAPEMVSNAAPVMTVFGGSSGIPVELPPLW